MTRKTHLQLSLFGEEWEPKEKKTRKKRNKPVKKEQEKSAPFILAEKVAQFLDQRRSGKHFAAHDLSVTIDWYKLFSWAETAYGGTQSRGEWTSRDAYDAMELGVNLHLLQMRDIIWKDQQDVALAKNAVGNLRDMLNLLPTQTKRTVEQQQFQQFSTPPHLGYIAAWVADLKKTDVMLEPSAGNGGLAIYGKLAGAFVYVNELSKRRYNLLSHIGFEGVFNENAEQLNNILPLYVQPNVVVMNPPFSATAGRIRSKGNKTQYAEAHLKQALSRLANNGRLVAITGKGMALDKPIFRKFWDEIQSEYNLRANIRMPGKEYAKYGTNFDNQLIVIDKNGPTIDDTLVGEVAKAEELIAILQEVKDDRPETTGKYKQDKQAAHQSDSLRIDDRTEGADSASLDTRTPSHATGRRHSKGKNQKPPTPRSSIPDNRKNETKPDSINSRPEKTQSGTRPDRDSATSPRETGHVPDRDYPGISEPSRIEVQPAEKIKARAELSDSLYDHYQPKIKIDGAKPHPTPLVESAAMAAVDLPSPKYQPKLLKSAIESGAFSDAQIEQIIYAGQAQNEMLAGAVFRKGYMVGDGTGVGKGREIAGVLWDNWNNGRKKALWITEKPTLFKDAHRDLKDVGWLQGAEKLFALGQKKVGRMIEVPEGIMFATYALLGRDFRHIKPDVPETLKNMTIRLNQIIDWLGIEFDGVIVFDECHNMANAQTKKTEFGESAPSQKAMAGVLLQNLLPKARVLYVSATAATEISNFAYLERLGLWGEGTAFSNKNAFISKVGAGGMASMELLASNMKAMGLYHARSLAWDGVTIDRLIHDLSNEQAEIYNNLANAWQLVLNNVNEALGITGIYESGRERGVAYSRFWGSHQRFFNQVITAMQMPTILEAAQTNLEDGNAVIFQLINTNEALLNRAMARMEDGDEYEDIDITPRDQLMEYIQNSFPIRQFEQREDDNGNILVVPVFDSQGQPVINQDAVKMRDQLLEELGSIKVPLGPLDMIIDQFGHDKVAEVTGRSKRIVYDEQKGQKVLQKRTNNNVIADMESFKNDDKKILVFSKSGNTGLSFHSDLTYKNQRKRQHYLVQPGWIAADAIQGIGRSHRSNQAHPPHYILCSTNLKGQKRFISSIARRLDQLGALTRGQRQTGGQGMFNVNDNLENDYAKDGLRRFYEKLFRNEIDGITLTEFETQTGMVLLDEYGALKAELPPINQFLNRLLSMNIDMQNLTFTAFEQQMDEIVQAHVTAGTLDIGIETLKAKCIEKIEEQMVFEDDKTGAQAKYVQVNVVKEAERITWEDITKKRVFDGGFYVNRHSNRIWAASGNTHQKTKKNGDVIDCRTLIAPNAKRQVIEIDYLEQTNSWERINDSAAKVLWIDQFEQSPDEKEERRHIFVGAVLPIWAQLKGHDRILRLQTIDGEKLLGREVSNEHIDETMQLLDAKREMVQLSSNVIKNRVMEDGQTYKMDNGWRIVKRKVSGDNRLEIIGPNATDNEMLKAIGVFTEIINWKTRYFIPLNSKSEEIMDRIIKGHVVQNMKGSNSERRNTPRM